jgi:GntR family transcriptional regulator
MKRKSVSPSHAVRQAPPSDSPFEHLSLSPGTGQPLYQQLLRQLREMISDGSLPPGTMLPSERIMAEMLGVSRITVKRCYTELHLHRQLTRHGRLGSIVSESRRLDPGMDRLKGFTQEMQLLGMVPSSRILERRVVSDRSVASIFSRPSNAKFLKLVRIRYGDGVPLSREIAWYDLGVAPALETAELLGGSVYRTLAELCDMSLDQCEQTVEAVPSSDEENLIFGFRKETPCLLIKRRSYARDQRMVEYVEGLFRGDLYVYRLQLKS